MGITNFLSPVIEASGHLVDLQEHDNPDSPLRIGIDISTWIYKACQGYSEILADERHLSHFGRATLVHQQQQQDHSEGDAPQNATPDVASDSPVEAASVSQDASTSPNKATVQEFVAKTCTQVVDQLVAMMQSLPQSQLLVVLDGATPPIKEKTTKNRRAAREKERELRDKPVDATEDSPALERRIKANQRTGAGPHYATVVNALLEAMRSSEIPFLVAPYEADGQLAYLQQQAYVNLVVTEDSDLLAYGPATPVLYKLAINQHGALTRGVLLRRSDLGSHKLTLSTPPNKYYDLTDCTPPMLACIYCSTGCDYTASLRGIGIKTAVALVRQAFLPTQKQKSLDEQTASLHSPLGKLLDSLVKNSWDRNMTEESKDEYRSSFLAALLMFRHAVVYDPVLQTCRYLSVQGDPELVLYIPYAKLLRSSKRRDAILGTTPPAPLARHVADGYLCPRTLKRRTDVEVPENVLKDEEQYMRKRTS